MKSALLAAQDFCRRFGLRAPILLAPMAGASPPTLSIAVSQAGGLGACGALLMKPDEIIAWAEEFRRGSDGPFQINLWIPDPPALRNPTHEARLREFLANWGPGVPEGAGDQTPPDFEAQCEALLEVSPPIVSSIMGLYPPAFVTRLRQRGIRWFANISTVAEARAAEKAGGTYSWPRAWRQEGIEVASMRRMRNGNRWDCLRLCLPCATRSNCL